MANETRPMRLEDYWKLKQVTEIDLSPDGRTVAYVVGTHDEKTNKTRSAIWLVDLETGATRQFTSGESSDTTPRWSPDGSRLAFVSKRHEDKQHVFVMPAGGGEPRRVTSIKDGAHTPVWSPDGRRLCVTSEVETEAQKVSRESEWFEEHPDADQEAVRMRLQTTMFSRFDGRGYIERHPHLFLVDLDTPDAEPHQLTSGDHDDTSPAWSPDGRLIAFLSNRMDDREHNRALDVWTIDVESGDTRCLTNSDLISQLPAWSPDGQVIAFYARPEKPANGYQDVHLWTVSREGGEPRDASAQLDRSCVGIVLSDYMLPSDVPPAWSPDGEIVHFIAVDRGSRAIFALSLRGGSVRKVSQTAAVVGGAQCTSDGRTLVCLAATATQPFDVFTVSTEGGELRQVTRTNADLMDEVKLAPTESIQFKGADDWDIEGWLITPGADIPEPHGLILLVHGGPQAAWGNAFYFWCQVLAGAGYASLLVNPRGSIGYGVDFARAADWGQGDFEDLMAGVDCGLARGNVDAGKLGITGASYGGFMTNWVLGHTDRFAAGVAVNSISNFVSFYGVSDIGSTWFERSFQEHFGGRFWLDRDHWEQYIARSPITYVENIKTPLLLISAENDYRCPIEQAEQMLTALRMLHRTVQLIRLPGASHGILASPHQRYVRWRVTKDWFDAYIRGEHIEQVIAEEEAVAAPEPVPVPGNQAVSYP